MNKSQKFSNMWKVWVRHQRIRMHDRHIDTTPIHNTDILYISHILLLRCKDTIPKIRNIYSQKYNLPASFPIPTFMFRWAIYIFRRSVCLFWCRKISGQIVWIDKSLTDKWMWKLERRGRAVSFRGTHKLDFLCSVQTDLCNENTLQNLWMRSRQLMPKSQQSRVRSSEQRNLRGGIWSNVKYST
jgi:hypothetical protein